MRIATPLAALAGALLLLPAASAQTAQTLPFAQDWTNTGLITTNDDWSGVPGIIGYRGDDLTTATGVDPQTILADGAGTPVDVNANQTSPGTFITGGLSEFEIANPVVAFQGSGTADAPHLVIRVVTTGFENIRVRYNLRDVDDAADDAVQQVALHYRVGTTGDYTNVPAGYVADASTGGTATQVTPVDVVLPADANNQPVVDIRVMTTNAVGSDEWIGVDDILITGDPVVANEPGADGQALALAVATNPARGAVAVRFALPAASDVRLALYDVTGREVAVLAEGARAAGEASAVLDAAALTPGVYVLRLTAGGASAAQTVTVAR